MPTALAAYLDSDDGRAALDAATIWFRWELREQRVGASGAVLKSTPEQMSRPGTAVFVRAANGPWTRYA